MALTMAFNESKIKIKIERKNFRNLVSRQIILTKHRK